MEKHDWLFQIPLGNIGNISLHTKLRIINTNVKAVLLYACETRKLYEKITYQIQYCYQQVSKERYIVYGDWREPRSGQTLIHLGIKMRKGNRNLIVAVYNSNIFIFTQFIIKSMLKIIIIKL